ncbi:MAG TPA: adenylate/guanylate cyclase domain-containing protein [Saprospiraceae bacterium]|nr:adenylate/guanylate cyclase domain-containing protein [Saprospiraceae bacterium]
MKNLLYINPLRKRKYIKILAFGLIGLIFGTVYAFIEKGLLGHLDHYPSTGNPYNFYQNSLSTIIQSGVMGIILGSTEVLLLDKFFSKSSFVVKFFFKSLIYISAILICVALFSVLSSSIVLGISLFNPVIFRNMLAFFTDVGFWSIMLYTGIIFSFVIFLSEMSDHLGQSVLKNFLLGKYHKPREEERIFMFLDIKSSTTFAEQLGHVKYFKFLNEYYVDITKAIINTGGEIYQYVGDEVIATWSLEDGIRNNNCLRCFFMSKSIINSHTKKYLKDFDLVPEFKAGLHYGHVSTGRIGVVKKEIVFTGDVLNTTARIQNTCNHYETDLLVSLDLIQKLNLHDKYETNEVGDCKLKGKDKRLKLFTVKEATPEIEFISKSIFKLQAL